MNRNIVILLILLCVCNDSFSQKNYFTLDFYFNGKLKTPHKVEIFDADSNKISTIIKGDTIFLLDSIPSKIKDRSILIYYTKRKSIFFRGFLLCDSQMLVVFFNKKLKHLPRFDSPIAIFYDSIDWKITKYKLFNKSCNWVNIYYTNKK